MQIPSTKHLKYFQTVNEIFYSGGIWLKFALNRYYNIIWCLKCCTGAFKLYWISKTTACNLHRYGTIVTHTFHNAEQLPWGWWRQKEKWEFKWIIHQSSSICMGVTFWVKVKSGGEESEIQTLGLFAAKFQSFHLHI